MRSFLSALFFAAVLPAAVAQNAAPADVIPGKALVKVKPQYKALFQANNSTARSAIPAKAIQPLAPGTASKRNTGRAQALKPVIDITQYFEITFDPTQPVAEYIKSLYATGYIETAEPEYQHHVLYTPNDPSRSSQYYLQTIRAYEAWDITQGSEDIIIAIVDTGGDLDHPDLASQLYINAAEFPANGIDDDGNGFIDDYRGWDFSGANAANIVGDNDPSIKQSSKNVGHGTSVASCASAATDDGVGMAGVGFKTRLLFTKHFSDNTTNGSYSTDTYQGVLYAAHAGAKIINCSWGSSSASAIYQDIITYVTLDLGCLVIAAAGNSANDVRIYPASYDHVISVAASTADDKAVWFTSYSHAVDISAPGDNMYIATYDNSYMTDGGTSLATPIVSGAAALLWAAHPEYTATQVGEQLRVTANPIINQNSPALAGQIGKGRLDVYAALTQQSPSVRAANAVITNTHGAPAMPGDTALLYFDFTNYLQATSPNLQITITPGNILGTAIQSTLNPGTLATGSTYTNKNTPFRIKTSDALGENVSIEVRIDYTDGGYQDYQYISLVFNPTYITLNENLITTTITSTGRLGFGDTEGQMQGRGFIFKDRAMLYEMGVIMGTSAGTILNNVRDANGDYDQDFVSLSPITQATPGGRSDTEVFGSFANSTTPAAQTATVTYRSMVWTEAPDDNFVILEYKIKNPQATPLTNFYYGIFADWDISSGGQQDAAGWNAQTQTGYTYAKQNTALPYAGIQLLTASPQYYAIDNNQAIAGNPFGLYDGFTDAEKFTALSTSTKTEAGISTPGGTDVSHTVATGPYTIAPGAEITIAFALLAADNLPTLLATAKHADTLYNLTLQAAMPIVTNTAACLGTTATPTASGASDFNWYTEFTGGAPVATGQQIAIPNIQKDTTLYVANAAKPYESVRTKVTVTTRPNPVAAFTVGTSSFKSWEPIQFTDASTDAGSWLWNFGDNTTSTQQNPAHTFTTGGAYTVKLTVTAANGCQDIATENLGVITGTEQALTNNLSLYPNPVSAALHKAINLDVQDSRSPMQATLTTPQGRKLTQIQFSAAQHNRTIDVTAYPPGLYLLTLSVDNVQHTYKIIVTP